MIIGRTALPQNLCSSQRKPVICLSAFCRCVDSFCVVLTVYLLNGEWWRALEAVVRSGWPWCVKGVIVKIVWGCYGGRGNGRVR